MKSRIVPLSALLFCLILLASWNLSRVGALGRVVSNWPAAPATDRANRAKVIEAYGRLPLRFEANAGQMDARVKFFSRGAGYGLFLMANEAVLESWKGNDNTRSSTLRMKLVNANARPKIEGLDQLPGQSNYLIGADPKLWQRGVPNYAKVRYREVYPGVDLVFYGNQNRLEYEFVVAPGADPNTIRLRFYDAGRISADAGGDLISETANGLARRRKPEIYQEMNGERRVITGGYELRSDNQIKFRVGAYNETKPLVINPAISYTKMLGGNGAEAGFRVAVDAAGSVYVTGVTTSTNFPTTPGAFQTAPAGGSCSNGFTPIPCTD